MRLFRFRRWGLLPGVLLAACETTASIPPAVDAPAPPEPVAPGAPARRTLLQPLEPHPMPLEQIPGAIGGTAYAEVTCDDFIDDDADGLYDCQDPDCGCVPGGGQTGAACAASTDCASAENDQVCLDEAFYGFKNGYCSQLCPLGSNDCPGDGLCLDVGDPTWGACFDGCVQGSDCPAWQSCIDPTFIDPGQPGSLQICYPSLETDPGGLSCSDFVDSDGDSLIDCADPDCGCSPGTGLTASPCTLSNECASAQNDATCLDQAGYGFVHGYCSEQCNLAANDCPGDGACIDLGLSVGACFDGCSTDADCAYAYHSCVDSSLIDPSLPAGTLICYPFENDCSDLSDNDEDGLLDCADPDCACSPGTGPTGSACTVSGDCASAQNDQLCLDEATYAFPHGYCSQQCNLAANDCPGDGACLDVGAGGACFDGCVADTDCLSYHSCISASVVDPTLPPGSNICYPFENDCSDLSDNDEDGLLDCADPDCACSPGAGPTASPCTVSGDCASAQNDQLCLDEATYAFPHGYCSQQCNLAANDCPGDGACLDVGAGGACFDGCVADAECLSYHRCIDASAVDPSIPSGTLICYPFEKDCGDSVDNDEDGLADCADTDCAGVGGCP